MLTLPCRDGLRKWVVPLCRKKFLMELFLLKILRIKEEILAAAHKTVHQFT